MYTGLLKRLTNDKIPLPHCQDPFSLLREVSDPQTNPIEVYHYHRYDDKGRPVISVCLIVTMAENGDLVYFRGVAVCSPKDFGVLRSKEGKRIARERAFKGLQLWRAKNAAYGLDEKSVDVLDEKFAAVFMKPSTIQMIREAYYTSQGRASFTQTFYYKWNRRPGAFNKLRNFEKNIIQGIQDKRRKKARLHRYGKLLDTKPCMDKSDIRIEDLLL